MVDTIPEMQLLVTNDDGIDAVGLAALAAAAHDFGAVTWVAPLVNWSVCGHKVTTDKPIGAEPRGPDRWAIDGTPADCVRLALAHLASETAWVLAGLNHGGNLGADVHHSGTVAAARESALFGRPSIAFSHYRKKGHEIDWTRATGWIRRVLGELLSRPPRPGAFWNVNLPHRISPEGEPRIVHCPLDTGPLPLRYRMTGPNVFHYDGDYHGRARQPGRDVEVCFGGDISVTELTL